MADRVKMVEYSGDNNEYFEIILVENVTNSNDNYLDHVTE